MANLSAAMANVLRRANQQALSSQQLLSGTHTPMTLDSGARSLSYQQVLSNYPGFKQSPITYDNNDPSKTLASISDREMERFQFFYRPVQQDVIRSLQDTSIVDDARRDLSSAFEGRQARTEREMRRFGLTADPATRAYMDQNAAMDRSLHTDSTMNEARLEQKERNDGLRRSLIDIGRGYSDISQSGLADAASNQAQRDAANRQAKAAGKAQNYQLAATALAAMMFI